jgi:transposase-like protein
VPVHSARRNRANPQQHQGCQAALEPAAPETGQAPKRRITGKLGSYGRAKKQVMPKVDHRAQKGLNILAENSHVPFRKPERIIQHFRSA